MDQRGQKAYVVLKSVKEFYEPVSKLYFSVIPGRRVQNDKENYF